MAVENRFILLIGYSKLARLSSQLGVGKEKNKIKNVNTLTNEKFQVAPGQVGW